jgi:hypothetical protein
MERPTFWRIIQSAKDDSKGDPNRQVALLTERLTVLPPEEIISFNTVLWDLMRESYTNDLWAAAYILNGGCSDDCFDYFRAWLIAQGEQIYTNALKDPESLAGVADFEEVELEDMLGVAWNAYKDRTGSKLPPRPVADPWHLQGEAWDEDTVEEKYPNLAALVPY